MERVIHKTFGIGEVVNRETKQNGTYITVCFENGNELRCVIPESFVLGVMVAEGKLKDEVDAAIAEKIALNQKRLQTTCPHKVATCKVTHRRSKKMKPLAVPVKNSIEAAFEEYLIKAGYKQETAKGQDSTVPTYVKAIKSVLREEGISWDTLKRDITRVAAKYDVGGTRETFGSKSNRTPINALLRFGDFVSA